jgi:ribonuclease III
MLDSNIIAKYQTFALDTLGFTFDDPLLIVTAFTHRSYVNEHKKSSKEHNERLEFLGDAVLELVVTEFLFANYSEPEGILTNWRAALVRTESISAAASRLSFIDYLRLSRGEKQGSDRARHQILANTFEAVVGAIYLDKGYEPAKVFITKHILATFGEILATGSWRDAKSRLQETAQSVDGMTPVYRVLSEEGPDHDKIFKLGVYVGVRLLGTGIGASKQAAQQEAAQNALQSYAKLGQRIDA